MASQGYDQPSVLAAEFQPRMQTLLATLADIDFAHEKELEKVNSTAVSAKFKAKIIIKLDQLHRERRHPYAQEALRLNELMRSRLARA